MPSKTKSFKKLVLSPDQKDFLKTSSKSSDPWRALYDLNPALWKKIKNYVKSHSIGKCCYCQRKIDLSNNGLWDVEHVLPKSVFPRYSFSLINLATSCKRCNSTAVKGAGTMFFTAPNCNHPFRSRYYSIIHPNIDNADSHLRSVLAEFNSTSILLYKIMPNSAKGKSTYDHFKLNDLVEDEITSKLGMKKKVSYDEVVEKLNSI